MIFKDWFAKGRDLTKENSTTILTGVGVTGTLAVAYLSGSASIKAYKLLHPEDEILELSKTETVKMVWPLYIPTGAVTLLTVASIVGANRLSSKETAALAAAYGISERAFAEYKEKVVEQIGKAKETKVRDEIAQDRVNKNPVSQVIITGKGDVLCYDGQTGRYFESNVEAIKKAQNDINHRIMHTGPESLSAFYDEIGLPATSMSDELGWNSNDLVEVLFSTTMSTDNRPCIAIDFANPPIPHYSRLY